MALVRKYSLYHQNMMWLTSPVTHFLTDVSQGTSPNFSKGWCVRELIFIKIIFQCNLQFGTCFTKVCIFSFKMRPNILQKHK